MTKDLPNCVIQAGNTPILSQINVRKKKKKDIAAYNTSEVEPTEAVAFETFPYRHTSLPSTHTQTFASHMWKLGIGKQRRSGRQDKREAAQVTLQQSVCFSLLVSSSHHVFYPSRTLFPA